MIDLGWCNTNIYQGKMLMFSKLSLKSFAAYDLIETFCFPTEEIREIYDRHSIIKCHVYLNLTHTDCCSISILFLFEIECSLKESEARNE